MDNGIIKIPFGFCGEAPVCLAEELLRHSSKPELTTAKGSVVETL